MSVRGLEVLFFLSAGKGGGPVWAVDDKEGDSAEFGVGSAGAVAESGEDNSGNEGLAAGDGVVGGEVALGGGKDSDGAEDGVGGKEDFSGEVDVGVEGDCVGGPDDVGGKEDIFKEDDDVGVDEVVDGGAEPLATGGSKGSSRI